MSPREFFRVFILVLRFKHKKTRHKLGGFPIFSGVFCSFCSFCFPNAQTQGDRCDPSSAPKRHHLKLAIIPISVYGKARATCRLRHL
ncbi:hypothetical protein L499_A2096 [Bordetella holmesii CDC-H635-BH]|uniref:Uncharacterized protein n=1 Tax=Bordetella holmesii CDC-H585-BH TaxID=1331206 RepID=A0A158M0U2_9BORD|nr:hypothetical protein L503_2080 [Bordetella holmesii CDC-H809-BH]KAK82156.1 hypothetical protein L573_0469 [Bordetella holmesii H620]KAK88283.1 hypothetical protein L497_2086 [Bordetella holmesii CDC-H585-BH]KAK89561.1 hypothetical protein L499_A2096 [Bordetella holmesii CDC-H635-BH]KCV03785.1 hypothetical protein L501_2084 [Bordetella holmesii CDC-H719-BH]